MTDVSQFQALISLACKDLSPAERKDTLYRVLQALYPTDELYIEMYHVLQKIVADSTTILLEDGLVDEVAPYATR